MWFRESVHERAQEMRVQERVHESAHEMRVQERVHERVQESGSRKGRVNKQLIDLVTSCHLCTFIFPTANFPLSPCTKLFISNRTSFLRLFISNLTSFLNYLFQTELWQYKQWNFKKYFHDTSEHQTWRVSIDWLNTGVMTIWNVTSP